MPVVKRDVTSLSKDGSAKLKGDVTLSEGTGVTLTQTGQDIEIAATGGSGSGDVTGPASSTDNTIAVFDGTDGKTIKQGTNSGQAVSIGLDGFSLKTPTGTMSLSGSNGVAGVSIQGALSVDDGGISAFDDVDVTGNITLSGTVDGRDVASDGTKLDGIEAGADVTDATNVNAAGATMNTDTSLSGNSYFLDEDNMASNDATKVPSQQSVKAYADTKQPLDSDLTTIAGLTATTDNIIQSVGSAWASRTPAQLKSTLALAKGDVGLGNVDNTSDATKDAAATTLTNKTLTTPTIAQINNSSAPGVKLQVRTQTDDSNSISSATTAGVFVQYGWGQMIGNSTAIMSESVTFPTAFTTVLGVLCAPQASTGNDSVAASSITDFEVSTGADGVMASSRSVSMSGFTVDLSREGASTFASNRYYGYSWIAWGV